MSPDGVPNKRGGFNLQKRAPAEPTPDVLTWAMPDTCHDCKQSLIEVDNRRRHLVGCLICNHWTDREGNVVELSEKDLVALYALLQQVRAPAEADVG